jgi:hypothetical protein
VSWTLPLVVGLSQHPPPLLALLGAAHNDQEPTTNERFFALFPLFISNSASCDDFAFFF